MQHNPLVFEGLVHTTAKKTATELDQTRVYKSMLLWLLSLRHTPLLLIIYLNYMYLHLLLDIDWGLVATNYNNENQEWAVHWPFGNVCTPTWKGHVVCHFQTPLSWPTTTNNHNHHACEPLLVGQVFLTVERTHSRPRWCQSSFGLQVCFFVFILLTS